MIKILNCWIKESKSIFILVSRLIPRRIESDNRVTRDLSLSILIIDMYMCICCTQKHKQTRKNPEAIIDDDSQSGF